MAQVWLVWLHILAAATWLGGAIFLAVVLVPIMRQPQAREQAAPLVHAIGARFRWVGWTCLSLLLASGVGLLALRGIGAAQLCSADFWRAGFGHTLGIKLLLVAAIFALSAVHDFHFGPRARMAMQQDPQGPECARFRRVASLLGRATVLLALAVVLLGVSLARGVLW